MWLALHPLQRDGGRSGNLFDKSNAAFHVDRIPAARRWSTGSVGTAVSFAGTTRKAAENTRQLFELPAPHETILANTALTTIPQRTPERRCGSMATLRAQSRRSGWRSPHRLVACRLGVRGSSGELPRPDPPSPQLNDISHLFARHQTAAGLCASQGRGPPWRRTTWPANGTGILPADRAHPAATVRWWWTARASSKRPRTSGSEGPVAKLCPTGCLRRTSLRQTWLGWPERPPPT